MTLKSLLSFRKVIGMLKMFLRVGLRLKFKMIILSGRILDISFI